MSRSLAAALRLVLFVQSLSAAAWGQALPRVVQGQVESLAAEKASRTSAQQKVDSQLLYAVRKNRGERFAAGLERFAAGIKLPPGGLALVDIRATVTPGLLADLAARGGWVVAQVPRFRSIRAYLPLREVEAVAARPEVQAVRPAAQAYTRVGSATSQGDATHRANVVRSTLGTTGRGVRIGVLSDSIDALAASQATGDLGPVTVLPGQSGLNSGNSGEGTAMLEIIRDLAPDAELFFATAFISDAQFAQNILDLRSAGCDVIVDDVGYFNESPFQDGPIAQAVNEVAASGALYLSSAGNEGNKNDNTSGTWEGDFVDGGPTSALFAKPGRLHRFGADPFNRLLTNGAAAALFWSDPAGASTNDYDLYVLDSTGTTILAASTNVQNGTQDPYELCATAANTRLVIVKAANAQPRYLHLSTLRGTLAQSTSGTIRGHPSAAGALAVAATRATNSFPNPFSGGALNPVEAFSSDGDRRVFYHADGTPFTPGDVSATGGLLRPKPDLTAANGVSTTVPGFASFFGTSAAAPHAAAIAALAWSRNRHLSAAQVRSALLASALDIETPGLDRDSGVGIVDALATVQSVPPGAVATFGGASLVEESFAPANQQIDPGENVTVELTLTNSGGAAAGELTATLLTSGGVSEPPGPQSFGALAAGATATRRFSFRANGALGSKVVATFRVTDGAAYLGTFAAEFPLGTLGPPQVFSNPAPIAINDNGVASPYPATIEVTGFTGRLGKVTVSLNNLTHTFPGDVVALLVGPGGEKVLLLGAVGGDPDAVNATLTFDDAAAAPLTAAVTGTYQPSPGIVAGTDLPSPAPAAPYGGTLGVFNAATANGTWSLYVVDIFTGDAGTFAGGWTLTLRSVDGVTGGPDPELSPVLTQSTPLAAVGERVLYTASVYNNGASPAPQVTATIALPANVEFADARTNAGSVASSANLVTASLGTLAPGQLATVTIATQAVSPGMGTATLAVALTGPETDPANNTTSATLTTGLPNLVATQAIIATTVGATADTEAITPADSVRLSVAFQNAGQAVTPGYFINEVWVDGERRRTFAEQLPVVAGATERHEEIELGRFAPGLHAVSFRTDATALVAESAEGDNTLTRLFLVQGPNLVPARPPGATQQIVVAQTTGTTIDAPAIHAGESVFVDFAVTNLGPLAAGASQVRLWLDDTEVASVPVTLAAGETSAQLDLPLGTLAAGVHTLRLVVDAGTAVAELDETDNETTKTFVINSLPTASSVAAQQIDEDGATATLAFTVDDVESGAQALAVEKASSNPAVVPTDGIVLGGTGANRTVTVTPAPRASGSSTITLTIRDGSGGVTTVSFTVSVAAVNDRPAFTAGPSLAVPDDAGPQTIPGWAKAIDPGSTEESGQALAFLVQTTAPELFAVLPAIAADGTLTFTPARGASGTATITARLRDDGGGSADTSVAATFQIAVTQFAEEVGAYHGLALPAPSATPGADKTGAIMLTVSRLGVVTGRLRLGARQWPIRGTVDQSGVMRFGRFAQRELELARGRETPLALTLALDVSGGTDTCTGAVTLGGGPFASISADRALYTDRVPVPPLLAVPAGLPGSFTAAFRAVAAPNGGLAADRYPQGDGLATLVLSRRGVVRLVGTLADGARVSAASPLSRQNAWPLYAGYSRFAAAVAGMVTFAPGTEPALSAPGLRWFKPAGSRIYPGGWPQGISLHLVGAAFRPAPGQPLLPGLGVADADGNARLSFSGGGLGSGLVKALAIGAEQRALVLAPAADRLAIRLRPRTGLISGSFIHPQTGRRVSWQAVVVRSEARAFGFFRGPTTSGAVEVVAAENP